MEKYNIHPFKISIDNICTAVVYYSRERIEKEQPIIIQKYKSFFQAYYNENGDLCPLIDGYYAGIVQKIINDDIDYTKHDYIGESKTPFKFAD